MADAFTTATGQRVELTFGASGLLLRQVVEGAPFDLFVSADETMVDVAIVRGACLRDTRSLYASGELSLWWRRDLPVDPPASLGDLADARFRHIAIANPDSAPYGRVAKEALVAAGVWDAVAPRLVYGENVRQALQFAQSGNAEVALVGRALAVAERGGDPRRSTRRSTRRSVRHSSCARTGRTLMADTHSPPSSWVRPDRRSSGRTASLRRLPVRRSERRPRRAHRPR